MFIINQDNTITIKCSDGEWKTFAFEEIDFEYYIKTGDIELADSGVQKIGAEQNLKL